MMRWRRDDRHKLHCRRTGGLRSCDEIFECSARTSVGQTALLQCIGRGGSAARRVLGAAERGQKECEAHRLGLTQPAARLLHREQSGTAEQAVRQYMVLLVCQWSGSLSSASAGVLPHSVIFKGLQAAAVVAHLLCKGCCPVGVPGVH